MVAPLVAATWVAWAAAAASSWPPATGATEKQTISFGVILPHSLFYFRQYNQRLKAALDNVRKANFNFSANFALAAPELHLWTVNPSPTTILNALCNVFLAKNVTAILYLSNADLFGATTASTQYFLQLAGYLGIPVLCWNADNSGLEQMSKNINLQLAPSVRHQSAAMLSILQRYTWHKFSIVTSKIAGHVDFLQAVRDLILELEDEFRLFLLETVVVDASEEASVQQRLAELAATDTRIVLLYSTRDEAALIMAEAVRVGLTGRGYVWLVTHSVIGKLAEAPAAFPSGMLGVHFDTSFDVLLAEIGRAVNVFAHGLELFVADASDTASADLRPNLTCVGQGESRWHLGETFYSYLRKVSVTSGSQMPVEFNLDGTLRYAELDIMNLNQQLRWEKIGRWTSDGLDIQDIVWPDNQHKPPPGEPEKFYLKVAFLEEPAFVNLAPPDPVSGQCINRGVLCHVGNLAIEPRSNRTSMGSSSLRNSSHQCCSGLSVDLLEKFAKDLSFDYDMIRVQDGYWGTEVNGTWNGLVAELLHRRADAVMTAFQINSYRETVIDFTEPFLETGIAIVVAKRTGIISPKAFLEPFDTISWLFILLIGIQVSAFAIFLFEWLSPYGYGTTTQLPRDHRFSLFRTYWLVWAILFGAAVNVDCPRSLTARFVSNVWAMFAVVFLAIYTANLAAFMITQEEYHNLSGIEDPRLSNPFSVKPPFRYGTLPYSSTEAVMRRNFERIHRYMRPYNRSNVLDAVQDVKKGELDAFVYDATVLNYLVGQDDDCKLLTVGSWYATTGYGIGFPKNSKYLEVFNKRMMVYRDNGDLERLHRFWLTGGCRPGKKDRISSNPLSLDQFMSAFLLLTCGILLAALLLLLEHFYFRYVREPLARADKRGCCALISLSMGRSLTFREAVYEARDAIRHHRCRDPLCDLQLWRIKHELDLARLRIRRLEHQLEVAFGAQRGPQGAEAPPAWPAGQPSSTAAAGQACAESMLVPRDLTRNHVTTTEPFALVKLHAAHSRHPLSTRVAELETVL